MIDLNPLIVTFQLALMTTVVLGVVGIPLAYGLAFSQSRWKYVLEPLVSMPLILPPTVLGFYLLMMFAPQSLLGRLLEDYFHIKIVFTFWGLVIGSVIFSLPFMVNPIKSGFEQCPRALIEAAYTLGKSKRETLWYVVLPQIKSSILTGVVMSFAHTIGEFGVVLMIGGNIPGETRTASMAIFNEVEMLNYSNAYVYSAILFVIAYVILFGVNVVSRKKQANVL